MLQYLRDTWDLHAGALVAHLLLAVILLSCGAIPAWSVPLVAVAGSLLSVFGGLWLLAMVGGSIPW